MKIIIDSVDYGVVPYGTDNGSRALSITFKEVEGDFDYEAEAEDKNEDGEVVSPEAVIARGLIRDTLSICKEKGYEVQWSNVLLAKTHCYFIGTCIASPDYRPIFKQYFKALSTAALEIQKEVISANIPEDQRASALMKGLRAPFTVYVCEPKYYTGRDQFYETFNLVFVKLATGDVVDYNPMAMVEVGNHNFAIFIIPMKGDTVESQAEVLKEKYEKQEALTLPAERTFIIDETDDERVAEFAVSKGYRINKKLSYSSCLDFDKC